MGYEWEYEYDMKYEYVLGLKPYRFLKADKTWLGGHDDPMVPDYLFIYVFLLIFMYLSY